MDEIEIRVTWKGKKAKMVLRQEDEGINGYVAKTKVLTLVVDDSEDEATTTESFHHEDLECDSDAVSEEVLEALEDEDDEDEEDEDEDEEDEDEEDEDEEDDEDEDEDEEDEDEEDDEGEEEKGDEAEESEKAPKKKK
jgi:hypothetical protein